jgi:hypothetical protein
MTTRGALRKRLQAQAFARANYSVSWQYPSLTSEPLASLW